MATIYYKIFKHHKKADGKYNIKYCLTHKGKQVYISSQHNVSDKQLIKTSMKLRDDKVLAEVLAEVVALERKAGLLDHYTARHIANRYVGYDTFLKAITKGMSEVSADIGKDITFYHARHTFATLAHNKCGFSKDEVAAALNHVDQSRRVTERYIARDWSVVDKVQAGVLGLLL